MMHLKVADECVFMRDLAVAPSKPSLAHIAACAIAAPVIGAAQASRQRSLLCCWSGQSLDILLFAHLPHVDPAFDDFVEQPAGDAAGDHEAGVMLVSGMYLGSTQSYRIICSS